ERVFFFSSRRRHTRCLSDWSSDVCSSDLAISRSAGCRLRFRQRNREEAARSKIQIGASLRWHIAGSARPSRRLERAGWLEYDARSEERRVGREGRYRWARGQWTETRRATG